MQPIQVVHAADTATLSGFDALIDVRSPAEFAQDHAPGGLNLPVLSDAERAEVGTIYAQESRFKAHRMGAAYVARNIARHLEGALADRPPDFKPLVYCWRGGERSNAMATILARVGWRTSVLAGGYRTYRRHVRKRLYDDDCALRLVLLDGDTGSAKTELLGRLAARGVQTLDLEGLGAHRGSLFGGFAGRPQPSQKMFESRLLGALEALDPRRPVLVEAESSKIGERMVPPSLWRAMHAAPRIAVAAPRPVRAAYLAEAYRDIVEAPERIEAAFERLPVKPSPARLESWRRLIREGAFADLAEALLELHYDPAYARARRKAGRAPMAVLETRALDEGAQLRIAEEIEQRLASL